VQPKFGKTSFEIHIYVCYDDTKTPFCISFPRSANSYVNTVRNPPKKGIHDHPSLPSSDRKPQNNPVHSAICPDGIDAAIYFGASPGAAHLNFPMLPQ
jgi:hypothetical protein